MSTARRSLVPFVLVLATRCGGGDSAPLGVAPVASDDVAPLPISGGTLLVTRDGARAVVADADLDRVVVVGLAERRVEVTFRLRAGDEPGRSAEDGAGRVHVVLRGAGSVVSYDLATGREFARRAVCPVPRGIAWDRGVDALRVVCAGGELVTLAVTGDAPPQTLRLDRDLRDVVVMNDLLLVTRFRSAETLLVDRRGAVTLRVPSTRLGPGAAVAWRAAAAPGGGAFILHTRAAATVAMTPGGYNQGGSACGSNAGIASPGVTLVRPPFEVVAGPTLPSAPLAVDLAVSADGLRLAAAVPGNLEADGRPTVVEFAATPGNSCAQTTALAMPAGSQAIAVAYTPDGALLAQTRAPAALVFGRGGQVIPLGGEARRTVGHDLFHTNPRGLVTCAGCHPEGDDDGRTWVFAPVGGRRTQNLRGGIGATAPFHWDGDLRSFDHLVDEVLVRRMGAAPPGVVGATSLFHWVEQLPTRTAPVVPTAGLAGVARGDRLFHDPVVACASCHAGPKLTDNRSVDVGTGGAFQVPTLRGIAWRAPYMHNGCAATLRERFSAACGGGDRHGRTSHLSAGDLDDLVAYLETL